MKKKETVVILIASLPILLHVYQPSLAIRGFELFLGFWGMYISPWVIFGFLIYILLKK